MLTTPPLPPFHPISMVLHCRRSSGMPGFTTFYPATFRSVIPFLLASLVYHCKWLKATLAVDHPLFLSHVWTSGTIPSLTTHVLSGVLKNKISGLVASGIPPHIPWSLQVA
ncbi:hypothetical protein H310_13637 [Aphanomyces invadans]|uniref:Uncharacterized protein n=1 Tax=Aphanomyces invadans TaxID=157072 RepID=A0A024TEL3_9STRA|nr:hypothetical protein H310_13637 [Aphanomyces invadans]ETV91792.1 hypothetical protein H310_13637 [Aphanomyces invadans]|eukprot:XP_008879429.1 hypothetical protein H310_13637 [Aphanomyces invadans]